jgi:hypothetical protein
VAIVIGYGTTLTVHRQAHNSDNDPVGPAVDTRSDGWMFAPGDATEDNDGGRGTRAAAVTTLRGYNRTRDLDIRSGDTAYLAGDDPDGRPPWRVVGTPELWHLDGTAPGGTVITLRRVTG